METGKSNLTFYSLLGYVCLLTLFAFSNSSALFAADKHAVLLLGATLIFIFWIIKRISIGEFALPRSGIIYALALLLLVTLLATVASVSFGGSLMGSLLDFWSFAIVGSLCVLAYVASVDLDSAPRLSIFYTMILAIAGVLFLLQTVHVLSGFTFLGVLRTPTSNLLGSWSDFGIFFGFVGLLSVALLEFSWSVGFFRVLAILGALTSVVVVGLADMGMLSLILVVGLLLLGILKFSWTRRLPLAALVVALLVALAWWAGSPGNFLASYIGSNVPGPLYVRPTLATTMAIAGKTLSDYPVLGVGTNMFAREWVKYKPLATNLTDFWSIDFAAGSGRVPTSLVETGALGLVAWLALVLALLASVYKLLRNGGAKLTQSGLLGTFALASALGSLYFTTVLFFFVPDVVLSALAFILLGVFVSSLAQLGVARKVVLSFHSRHVARSITVVALVLLGVGGLYVGYALVDQYRAVRLYAEAINQASANDAAGAFATLSSAVGLDEQDLYYRTMADLGTSKLVLSSAATGDDAKAKQQQFALTYGRAVNDAQKAVSLDPTNYLNYLTLGNVYELATELKVGGAYELAHGAYAQAAALNPTNPSLQFQLARLEVARGVPKASVSYLNASIALKPNYAPTYLLASQIALSSGDIATAIKSSELGAQAAPDDATAFFQLGYLRYQNRDFRQAIDALNDAIALSPGYANAKYFLGLSYYQIGSISLAVKEFTDLVVANPGNSDLTNILGNLKAGRPPL